MMMIGNMNEESLKGLSDPTQANDPKHRSKQKTKAMIPIRGVWGIRTRPAWTEFSLSTANAKTAVLVGKDLLFYFKTLC